MACYHKEPDIPQRLLTGLPCNTLPLVKTLMLASETIQPLPTCLPGLVSTMNGLHVLRLYSATAATLADTLQAIARARPHTLEWLYLTYSQFSPPAMAALSALLEHSTSLTILGLQHCDLTHYFSSTKKAAIIKGGMSRSTCPSESLIFGPRNQSLLTTSC